MPHWGKIREIYVYTNIYIIAIQFYIKYISATTCIT